MALLCDAHSFLRTAVALLLRAAAGLLVQQFVSGFYLALRQERSFWLAFLFLIKGG